MVLTFICHFYIERSRVITMEKNNVGYFFGAFTDKSSLFLAIKMSLVVGTLLNCINQGECLVTQEFNALNVPKLIFTYTVPFFVSIYSSTITKLKR